MQPWSILARRGGADKVLVHAAATAALRVLQEQLAALKGGAAQSTGEGADEAEVRSGFQAGRAQRAFLGWQD